MLSPANVSELLVLQADCVNRMSAGHESSHNESFPVLKLVMIVLLIDICFATCPGGAGFYRGRH